MPKLDEKVALVTGGTSGIGLAAASALAKRGRICLHHCSSRTRTRNGRPGHWQECDRRAGGCVEYRIVRPNSFVLNKEQVLSDLREQGLTFHRIDLEDTVIRVFGSAAILTAERARQHRRATGRPHMRTSGLFRCMLRRVTRSDWSSFRARCSLQGPQKLQTR